MSFIQRLEKAASHDQSRARLFLFLLLVWALLTLLWALPNEQDDLGQRSTQALKNAYPAQELTVAFSGRDGSISGAPALPHQITKVMATVEAVEGVRRVRYVATSPPRSPLLREAAAPAAAKASMPMDEARATASPPAAAVTTATVSTVPDSPPLAAANSEPMARSNAAPIPVTPAQTAATPVPSQSPSGLHASWDGAILALSGTVPDEDTRDALIAATRNVFARSQAHADLSIDHASALPPLADLFDWLRSLRDLRDGNLYISANGPRLEGRAGTEQAFRFARDRLLLSGASEQALADILLVPYEASTITLSGQGGQVALTGRVHDLPDRMSLDNQMRSMFGSDHFSNEVVVDRNVQPRRSNLSLLLLAGLLRDLPAFEAQDGVDGLALQAQVDSAWQGQALRSQLENDLVKADALALSVVARSGDEVLQEIAQASVGRPIFVPYGLEVSILGKRALRRAAEMLHSYPGYQLRASLHPPDELDSTQGMEIVKARGLRLAETMRQVGMPMQRVQIDLADTAKNHGAIQFSIEGVQ